MMMLAARELGVAADRMIGTAASAVPGTVRALLGLETDGSGADVSVVVTGRPPASVVAGDANGGSLAADRVPHAGSSQSAVAEDDSACHRRRAAAPSGTVVSIVGRVATASAGALLVAVRRTQRRAVTAVAAESASRARILTLVEPAGTDRDDDGYRSRVKTSFIARSTASSTSASGTGRPASRSSEVTPRSVMPHGTIHAK